MVYIKTNMQMSGLNALRLPGVCNRSTDAYGNETFQEEDKWQFFCLAKRLDGSLYRTGELLKYRC